MNPGDLIQVWEEELELWACPCIPGDPLNDKHEMLEQRALLMVIARCPDREGWNLWNTYSDRGRGAEREPGDEMFMVLGPNGSVGWIVSRYVELV